MELTNADRGLDLLTYSRMQCDKTCHRKHWYQYLWGIRRARSQGPLRFGAAFHKALDWLAQGVETDEVCCRVRVNYADVPEWADPYLWEVECVTVVALVYGYEWRWREDDIYVISTENVFESPIINPHTGKPSRAYRISGKCDKIVELADGRCAVMEHKTTGDSIDSDSDYWRRVHLDHQVTLYLWAARARNHVETIIYDVIRKPSIGPHRATPEDKRKYRQDGTLYANQRETDETPAEFGKRLLADIQARPDFYYRRQEVPRLRADIDEFLTELWQQQKAMRAAENNGWHFRNTGACTAPYRCEYLDICRGTAGTGDVPEGFELLEYVHPELRE